MISAFTHRSSLARGVLLTAVCLVGFLSAQETQTVHVDVPPYGITFPARVVRVVDGDTIDVEFTRIVRIRLLGFDAPELHPRNGSDEEKQAETLRAIEAKLFMEDLSLNRQVKISVPVQPEDRFGESITFGRPLGHVWLQNGDGETLSERMIKAGHAK